MPGPRRPSRTSATGASTVAGRARPGTSITFLRTVEDMFVEWRRMERTGLRRAQEAVLPLWERTRLFRAYSSWLIPGAVQTRAYTGSGAAGHRCPGGTCPMTWKTR